MPFDLVGRCRGKSDRRSSGNRRGRGRRRTQSGGGRESDGMRIGRRRMVEELVGGFFLQPSGKAMKTNIKMGTTASEVFRRFIDPPSLSKKVKIPNILFNIHLYPHTRNTMSTTEANSKVNLFCVRLRRSHGRPNIKKESIGLKRKVTSLCYSNLGAVASALAGIWATR